MKRKKEERRLCGATLKTAEVAQTYSLFLTLQVGKGGFGGGNVFKSAATPFHQHGVLYCVCCCKPVDNSNLGGHARKSALAGALWCLQCADFFPQPLLAKRRL